MIKRMSDSPGSLSKLVFACTPGRKSTSWTSSESIFHLNGTERITSSQKLIVKSELCKSQKKREESVSNLFNGDFCFELVFCYKVLCHYLLKNALRKREAINMNFKYNLRFGIQSDSSFGLYSIKTIRVKQKHDLLGKGPSKILRLKFLASSWRCPVEPIHKHEMKVI